MKNIETKSFNGKTFAKLTVKLNEESMQSQGIDYFFKKTKNGVTFYRQNKEPFAFLATRDYSAFFVTATPYEGKVRYMYSTTNETENMLNLTGLGVIEESDLAQTAKEIFFQ